MQRIFRFQNHSPGSSGDCLIHKKGVQADYQICLCAFLLFSAPCRGPPPHISLSKNDVEEQNMDNDFRNIHPEKDELRARFTAWLDVVVYHAKLKYIRKFERKIVTIPLDEAPESFLQYSEAFFNQSEFSSSFDFEEEKLAKAYSSLPLMRREILRLLFVEDLKAVEIAKRLNCSVQHVYNQRSLALKRLRQLLSEDGNQNEKE